MTAAMLSPCRPACALFVHTPFHQLAASSGHHQKFHGLILCGSGQLANRPGSCRCRPCHSHRVRVTKCPIVPPLHCRRTASINYLYIYFTLSTLLDTLIIYYLSFFNIFKIAFLLYQLLPQPNNWSFYNTANTDTFTYGPC